MLIYQTPIKTNVASDPPHARLVLMAGTETGKKTKSVIVRENVFRAAVAPDHPIVATAIPWLPLTKKRLVAVVLLKMKMRLRILLT